MTPDRTNKGPRKQAFGPYKRTYLGFLRSIHETQLVSAVAELSLRDFPNGLPSSAASEIREAFTKMRSALLSAASRAEAGETAAPDGGALRAAVRTGTKGTRQRSDPEAGEIAIDALYLMLAMELTKKNPPVRDIGRQFQILTRHQAVAMLYAHVDAFFGDTLRVICRARPEVLRTGRQLAWDAALSCGSMEDLESALSEQFTYEFGWKTLADRMKFFRDKFGMDIVVDVVQLELLTLFEQRRHLIIHNGGVATAKYIAETGDAHAEVGRQIPVSRDEVRELGRAVMMFGSELCSTVAVKFLGAKSSDLTQVWRAEKDKKASRH
jgi:hypothetical protein